MMGINHPVSSLLEPGFMFEDSDMQTKECSNYERSISIWHACAWWCIDSNGMRLYNPTSYSDCHTQL